MSTCSTTSSLLAKLNISADKLKSLGLTSANNNRLSDITTISSTLSNFANVEDIMHSALEGTDAQEKAAAELYMAARIEVEKSLLAVFDGIVFNNYSTGYEVDYASMQHPIAMLMELDKDGNHVLKKEAIDVLTQSTLGFVANDAVGNTRIEDVQSMLGLAAEDAPSPSEMNALSNVTQLANTAQNLAGSVTFQNLGLTFKKGVTDETKGKLRTNLGQVVLLAANELGFLSLDARKRPLGMIGYHPGYRQSKREIFGSSVKSFKSEQIATYRVLPEAEANGFAKDHTSARDFVTLKKNVKKLDEMLNAYTLKSYPTLKPVDNSERTDATRGANQAYVEMDQIHKDAVDNMSQVPFTFVDHTMKLYWELSNKDDKGGYDTDFLESLGYNSTPEDAHIFNLEGINGKNRAILEDLFYLDAQYSDAGINPFYFDYKVNSSNTRFDQISTTFTPMSKKLHRFTTSTGAVAITEKNLSAFKAAVGQALEVKVDKQTAHASDKAFDKLEKQFRKEIENGLSDREIAIKHMSESSEPAHTMAGVAEMLNYIRSEGKAKTSLPLETDAVTSGYILKLLQLPIFRKNGKLDLDKVARQVRKGGITLENLDLNTDLIKRVMKAYGIPIETSLDVIPQNALSELAGLARTGKMDSESLAKKGITLSKSEAESLDNSLLDAYEYPAKQVETALENSLNPKWLVANIPKMTIARARYLVKESTEYIKMLAQDVSFDDKGNPSVTLGRSFMKNPFMIFNYGAGVSRIVGNKVELLVEKMYTDLVANKDNTDTGIDQMRRLLTIAKPYVGSDPAPGVVAMAEAVERDIARLNAIDKMPNEQYTKALRSFLLEPASLRAVKKKASSVFGTPIKNVFTSEYSELMEATETINNSLVLMFRQFKKKLDKQIDEYTLEHNISPPTKLVDKWINDYGDEVPFIRTALGDRSKQKQRLMMMTKEATTFAKVDSNGKPLTETGQAALRTAAGPIPGESVAYQLIEAYSQAAVLSIHNIDATIIADVLREFTMLGVHDAGLYDIDTVEPGSAAYNKATIELAKKFSLSTAILESFNANLMGVAPKELTELDHELIEEDYFTNPKHPIGRSWLAYSRAIDGYNGPNSKELRSDVRAIMRKSINAVKGKFTTSVSLLSVNPESKFEQRMSELLELTTPDALALTSGILGLLSGIVAEYTSPYTPIRQVRRLGNQYAMMSELQKDSEEAREAMYNDTTIYTDHVAYTPSINQTAKTPYVKQVPKWGDSEESLEAFSLSTAQLNAMGVSTFTKTIRATRAEETEDVPDDTDYTLTEKPIEPYSGPSFDQIKQNPEQYANVFNYSKDAEMNRNHGQYKFFSNFQFGPVTVTFPKGDVTFKSIEGAFQARKAAFAGDAAAYNRLVSIDKTNTPQYSGVKLKKEGGKVDMTAEQLAEWNEGVSEETLREVMGAAYDQNPGKVDTFKRLVGTREITHVLFEEDKGRYATLYPEIVNDLIYNEGKVQPENDTMTQMDDNIHNIDNCN